MNSRELMFDKDSGEVSLAGLKHSVAGDDEENEQYGGEEKADANLGVEAAAAKAAAAKTSERRELKGHILLVPIKRWRAFYLQRRCKEYI